MRASDGISGGVIRRLAQNGARRCASRSRRGDDHRLRLGGWTTRGTSVAMTELQSEKLLHLSSDVCTLTHRMKFPCCMLPDVQSGPCAATTMARSKFRRARRVPCDEAFRAVVKPRYLVGWYRYFALQFLRPHENRVTRSKSENDCCDGSCLGARQGRSDARMLLPRFLKIRLVNFAPGNDIRPPA
jgi:hypothetical protein